MSLIDKDIEAELRAHKPGLIAFNLKSVDEELTAFKEFAGSRLTQSSIRRLDELQAMLPQLAQAARGEECKWATPLDRPLVTVPNRGAHQVNRTGNGYNLQAEIHFKWDFVPLGQYSKKRPGHRIVVLKDSSVKVRVFEIGRVDGKEGSVKATETGGEESSAKECVAAWDFDVGNDESPGCHFHAKYHETEELRREAYDAIDVPRLPAVAFMLTDAIEFVIGELWQDESRRLMGNSDFAQWYKIARTRMLRVFEWYSAQLQGARGSPWMSIKFAKPPTLLFLDPTRRL